jgi:hypothetical protein
MDPRATGCLTARAGKGSDTIAAVWSYATHNYAFRKNVCN